MSDRLKQRGSPSSIDEYIRRQPPTTQLVLDRVRAVIRRALPDAEEVISYSIPAFRLHGRVVIFFAGWKAHFAIYPATGRVTEVFHRELARFEVSKGTIRFPLTGAVPARLIAGIAKLRAAEAAERVGVRSQRGSRSGRARSAAGGSRTRPRPGGARKRTRSS